ncbi:hypothetical protein ANANG_G00028220, partial [Anguilla anguilla]
VCKARSLSLSLPPSYQKRYTTRFCLFYWKEPRRRGVRERREGGGVFTHTRRALLSSATEALTSLTGPRCLK